LFLVGLPPRRWYMANQQAKRDDNRVPALLIHDSTGAETRQVRGTAGNPNALPVEIVAGGGGGTGESANQVQGTAAHDAVAVGNPVLVGGVASASAPTDVSADGDAVRAWFLRNGAQAVIEAYLGAGEDLTNNVLGVMQKPIVSSSYSWTPFNAVLNDVDISVKATSGNIGSLAASNINAAVRYLQIFNKSSAPANPDVPVLSFPIPAGSATVPGYLSLGMDELGAAGLNLATGIAVGVSTTAATFTAATTTDHVVMGRYV
jgi:hypothetical protein